MNSSGMRYSVVALGVVVAFLLVMVDSGFRYDSLKKELEALRAQVNSIEKRPQAPQVTQVMDKNMDYSELISVLRGIVQHKFDFKHRILMTQKYMNPGTHTRPPWGNEATKPYSFSLSAQQWRRLPEDDWYYHMFNTCAIVGSDDALRHQNYAAEIDAHDQVFRMKEAPTIGFEFVGTKTTFRLAYAPGDVDNNPHEWVIENDERILYIPTYNNIETYWRPDYNLTTTNSFLIDPYFTTYANDIIEVHPWCSTGWVGFVLGVHVCEHVDLYGFSEKSTHYKRYFSPPLKGGVFHSKHEEESMMNLFDKLGIVRWRK